MWNRQNQASITILRPMVSSFAARKSRSISSKLWLYHRTKIEKRIVSYFLYLMESYKSYTHNFKNFCHRHLFSHAKISKFSYVFNFCSSVTFIVVLITFVWADKVHALKFQACPKTRWHIFVKGPKKGYIISDGIILRRQHFGMREKAIARDI